MNRRTFVKTAGAISALSYNRLKGANDRIGVGLIGAGRRGTLVSQAFLSDPRSELQSVCDINPTHRDRLLKVLKVADTVQSTGRHEDVLAHPKVDAVILAVPDHLHASIGEAVLGAKKHLYLEKPTIHRWKERTALDAAAHSFAGVLQCGTQQRSGAHYIQAKQAIFGERKLGQVVFARAVWSNFPWQCRHIVPAPQPADLDWQRFLGPAPKVPYDTARYDSWRYFPDYGGGLLADILTHWADVAQWMLDDTRPVTAQSAGGIYAYHDGRVNPDTVNALIRYNNWNLSFESSVLPLRNDRPSVFFQGTEGTLDLARDGYTFQPNKGAPVRVDAGGPLENAHASNFLDAVVRGTAVSAPLRSGIDACRPVQMALLSFWRNEVITESQLETGGA